MMEQAWGRGHQTPFIHAHTEPAWHSYVREEGKPLLEINYSIPFTQKIWGFLTLVLFSGHTPLPRDVRCSIFFTITVGQKLIVSVG